MVAGSELHSGPGRSMGQKRTRQDESPGVGEEVVPVFKQGDVYTKDKNKGRLLMERGWKGREKEGGGGGGGGEGETGPGKIS